MSLRISKLFPPSTHPALVMLAARDRASISRSVDAIKKVRAIEVVQKPLFPTTTKRFSGEGAPIYTGGELHTEAKQIIIRPSPIFSPRIAPVGSPPNSVVASFWPIILINPNKLHSGDGSGGTTTTMVRKQRSIC